MGQLKNLDMEEIADSFDKGWVANSRFISQLDNPYPKGSDDWFEWDEGWRMFRDYHPEENDNA